MTTPGTHPIELHMYARDNGKDTHLGEVTVDAPVHTDPEDPTRVTVAHLEPIFAEGLRYAADTLDPTRPRLFTLQRDHDHTGATGTGTVADGVVWPDGTVTIRWRGERASTVNWSTLADAEAVHGHGGSTRIVWAGAAPDDREDPQ